MFKKLLLSLISVVPVVAQAEWIEMATSEEYTSYIDPKRIVATTKSLKYAETWIKMVIHTDLTKDGLSIGDYKLVKYKLKCDSREFGLAAIYDYKKTGQLNNSYIPNYIQYESVIPESRGELMSTVVCTSLFSEPE